MRWREISIAAAFVLAGCAGGGETLVEDTLPPITGISTTTTSTTTPPTTSIVPITAAATTVIPPTTATRVTFLGPTIAPDPTPAPPPAAATTAAPAPAPAATPAPAPAPAPAPPAAPPAAPTTAATTTAAATTTSTLPVVTPSFTPAECSAAALAVAQPGMREAPVCVAGWAFETPACPPGGECGDLPIRLYQITPGGWSFVGEFGVACPEVLADEGVPWVIAEELDLNSPDCTATDPTPNVIRRGDEGEYVTALQVALNWRGYDIEADGIFGPATEAAVRDLQSTHGLEVDGLAGPATQLAVFAPD